MSVGPGFLEPAPPLRALGPVSPSHAVGLTLCALREVWTASRAPHLLPLTPAARLGIVAHRLLEESGRGLLNGLTSDRISARWDEILRRAEEDASRSWLDRHLVPLAGSIPDFEVRKLRAIARASALANEATRTLGEGGSRAHATWRVEVPVATPDGSAAGRIDAVVRTLDGPVIRDYKSGAIHEAGGAGQLEIKGAFSVQLKLYAAIYAAMTGTWPVRLEVVPLVGAPESVPFSREECVRLLSDAVRHRDQVNRIIESEAPIAMKMSCLASPSPSTCAFCPYRPGCRPYTDAIKPNTDSWPIDARGRLVEKKTLGSGRELLTLEVHSSTIRIRGLSPSPSRHPAVNASVAGDNLAAFNLRSGGGQTSFTEGPFTVFYVDPDQYSQPLQPQ